MMAASLNATALPETGCDKGPFYCADHMVSLSGARDDDQACKRCVQKSGQYDPDFMSSPFPFCKHRDEMNNCFPPYGDSHCGDY